MKTTQKSALPTPNTTLGLAGILSMATVLGATSAGAQTTTPAGASVGVTMSIDLQSAQRGATEAFSSRRIGGGDILTPGDGGAPGPNPPILYPTRQPGIVDTTRDLGLVRYKSGTDFPSRAPRHLEVDALSYGKDRGDVLVFSVLEQARANHPAIKAEVLAEEASADVFALQLSTGSITQFLDGDGNTTAGLGLIEPNPDSYALRDEGDNLDAIDIDSAPRDEESGPIYFSLDGAFSDLTEPRRHSGSAERNLVSPADVLVQTSPGAAMTVFADAASLGLTGGPWDNEHDDLDALALWENGNGIFDPYQPTEGSEPDYSKDVILFSVRAGSRIIGWPCPITGRPIEEGDILTVPPAGGTVPVIIYSADDLGLVSHHGDGSTKASVSEVDAIDISEVSVMQEVNPTWDPSGNPVGGDDPSSLPDLDLDDYAGGLDDITLPSF